MGDGKLVRSASRRLTAEEKAQIVTALRHKTPIGDIVLHHGVTKAAIYRLAHKHGVTNRTRQK